MSNMFCRFKNSLTVTLSVATLFAAIAGVQMAQTGTAEAAVCDKVNIINCGLEGSNQAEYVSSLKTKVANGTDNGHTDLKAVMNWAGASNTDLTGLNTSNTKMGTVYRNGEVKVGNDVVATDAWVSARFTEGQGFVQIKDGVWARKTTTSFANDSQKALVHYDENNQVDFVVIIDCGNAVKVTPVKVTPPKPALACTSLVFTAAVDKKPTYKFAARATASNTTITGYTFTFSDGTTEVVTTSAEAAELTHTFAETNKTYTASVAVSSNNQSNVTSAACKVSLTTPKVEECKPGVPVGSKDCDVTPVAVVTPETPTELVNVGPGGIVAGLFAGTSVLGAVGHRFISRRMNRE